MTGYLGEYEIYFIPIKGYGLGRVIALLRACRMPPLFRSFWLLVGALQGNPENFRDFQDFS